MKSKSIYLALISSLLIANSTPADATVIGLPNAKLTPGAIDPRVTQANISSTICVLGYTKTVRPPVTYTNSLKYRQLHSGYNVSGDLNMRDYEEDHLIPLEVGGNPTSEKNLFPQYYAATYGARMKDKLENRIHLLVCSGQLTLKAGQAAFAPDWTVGYKKYMN
jgi:hypothetical protein